MDRAGTAVRSNAVDTVDRRSPGDVGRRATLEIHFGVRRGRTVITHGYAEPPFRISAPFDRDGELHLIMTMSAPGIFGGDDFRQRIVVEPGARVRLTSQSALQVHPSTDGHAARTSSLYEVGEAASLTCQWDPLIPFPDARLENSVSIAMAAGARLLWSDAMMAGREARGERWEFRHLQHELSLRRSDQLIYLERYRLEPAGEGLDSAWIAGVNSYFGTTLISSTGMDGGIAERLHHEMQGRSGVTAAVDRLEAGLLLVRLAGERGAVFHRTRTECAAWLERLGKA
jgi:urease accessory protein